MAWNRFIILKGISMIQYTLTGAADWPMLASVGGFGLMFFQVIVLGLIGLVWRSLPKHQDLQNLKSEINIDIKELQRDTVHTYRGSGLAYACVSWGLWLDVLSDHCLRFDRSGLEESPKASGSSKLKV